jgi:hypothetical protein
MNSNLSTKAYLGFGIFYGLCRSWYWLSKTNSESLAIKHPHTVCNKLFYTCISVGFSQSLWPIFVLSDLNYYEKKNFGIKEVSPPFPFQNLKLKDI